MPDSSERGGAFWPDRPKHNHWKASEFPDYGTERISAEAFSGLPTRDPGGNHVHWREMIDGRWWLCYRGSTCGVLFSFRHRPIVQIAAAPPEEPRKP